MELYGIENTVRNKINEVIFHGNCIDYSMLLTRLKI